MIDKDKLDYTLSGLQSHLYYVKNLIEGEENAEQEYKDNFKVEEPEELLYGIYRSASDIYRFTRDERFKKVAREASQLYSKLKNEQYAMPVWHF